MAGTNGYTDTEKRILKLLSDGQAHTRQEIHSCLWDDQSDLATVRWHIFNIRKKLQSRGEYVVCELRNRTTFYRHVRLLASPYTE